MKASLDATTLEQVKKYGVHIIDYEDRAKFVIALCELALRATRPEALLPDHVLAAAEETISKGMSWIGGFICSGPEQEVRRAGMIDECRDTLAAIRAWRSPLRLPSEE